MSENKLLKNSFGSYPSANDVLKSEQVGFWAIEYVDGKEPRLYADDIAKTIFEITEYLSPEEAYKKWLGSIKKSQLNQVIKAYKTLDPNREAEIQYPFILSNDRTIVVRTGGSRNLNFTDGIRLECSVRDVSKLVHYEKDLQQEHSIFNSIVSLEADLREEQAIKDCFEVLTNDVEAEDAIIKILKICGEYYKSKRICVFEFDKYTNKINCTYECCSPLTKKIKDKLQNIPVWEFTNWIRVLKQNGSFIMENANDERNSQKGRKTLLSLKINKCMAVPINRGSQIVGFIAVENQNSNIPSLLKTATIIIHSELLKRNQNDESQLTLENLVNNFLSVYYVDLSTDYLKVWKGRLDSTFKSNRVLKYSKTFGDYIKNYIAEEDRKRCLSIVKPSYIIEKFNSVDRFSIDTIDILDGRERNVVFNFIKVSNDGPKMVICSTDITQNIAKEKEQQNVLQEALARADDANKAKSSFLFNISHDLRTPMNAIIGFTTLAMNNIDNKEKVAEYIQKTQDSEKVLYTFINNILELSRIESGLYSINEQPGDVYLSFANIEEIMKVIANSKNINLSFSFKNIKDRYVFCDFTRCMRIFMNIISNAVKYTPNGGKVEVTCEQISESINKVATYRYTFKDNGIGMSEEYQQHVFEQFTRENSSTVSGIEGTGLGMTVVKTFVDMLGGHISFVSKKNVGTTFIVDLPFKIQNKKERYVNPKTDQIVSANRERNKTIDNVDTKSFTGTKVLLVEDNALNAEITTEILKQSGFVVENAEDGTIALNILKDKGPAYYDLILMDIQMPIMNGYEATKAIREMYPKEKIPIIALSANAFDEDKKASLEAGMNAHISKPINIRELFNVIKEFL